MLTVSLDHIHDNFPCYCINLLHFARVSFDRKRKVQKFKPDSPYATYINDKTDISPTAVYDYAADWR